MAVTDIADWYPLVDGTSVPLRGIAEQRGRGIEESTAPPGSVVSWIIRPPDGREVQLHPNIVEQLLSDGGPLLGAVRELGADRLNPATWATAVALGYADAEN